MRAYLRFSLLGGVVAEQIRRLGYSARACTTVLDGDVLQPPLLLLSGLGEVCRIGEVILNPYLGPRLKIGIVTTDLPIQLRQAARFRAADASANNCNKCARECPSGAITAGPKLMYNGYEIWKSDAEKCARYRITNAGGGMCGRCMKTCPWNLEGLFAEAAFRWLAMHFAGSAGALDRRLDDALGRGGINPVKKWWWDIELDRATGGYVRAKRRRTRAASNRTGAEVRGADARRLSGRRHAAAVPGAVPGQPRGRHRALSRAAHAAAIQGAAGARRHRQAWCRRFRMPEGEPPVFPVRLKRARGHGRRCRRVSNSWRLDGGELPAFEAGAHIDVVIAPEYQRAIQPGRRPGATPTLRAWRAARARRPRRLGTDAPRVPRGPPGLHLSRRVITSRCTRTRRQPLLFAGGIGVTPMIAMAHRLHALGRDFELHYSAASRPTAGFMADLSQVPWARPRAAAHEGRRRRAPTSTRCCPAYQPGFSSTPAARRATWTGCSPSPRARAGPTRRCTANTSACPRRRSLGQPAVHAETGAQRPRAAGARRAPAPPRCWPRPASPCRSSAATACAASARRAYDAAASRAVEHRDMCSARPSARSA